VGELGGGAAWLLPGAVSARPPSLPPIGTIDFYGLRTRSASDVRALLPFAEGDVIERRRTRSPRKSPQRSASCASSAAPCAARQRAARSYVGVEERPRASSYRAMPMGDVTLPGEIVASVAELDTR
jgi:hypothetical protein